MELIIELARGILMASAAIAAFLGVYLGCAIAFGSKNSKLLAQCDVHLD